MTTTILGVFIIAFIIGRLYEKWTFFYNTGRHIQDIKSIKSRSATLELSRLNAEENFISTPISVLRYISELESYVMIDNSAELKTGTIIKITEDVNNYPENNPPKLVNTYYELCEGEFTITCDDCDKFKLKGQHFVCKGSDFWTACKGSIAGFELIDEDSRREYVVVDKLPNNLMI